MNGVSDLIQQGRELHMGGRLDDALRLYGRALESEPGNPDALHLTGLVAQQQGRHQDAVALIGRAIAANDRAAAFHNNLGLSLMALGRIAEAVAAFSRALDRDGDHLGAQHGLLECLNRLPEDVDESLLEALLLPLLRAPSVNARSLGHATGRFLERKFSLGAGDGAISQESRDGLLDGEIPRRYLRRTVNVSVPLEGLLSGFRRQWLAEARAPAVLAPARWDGVAAVAVQCFLNEYVWAVTGEEECGVDALEQRIVNFCSSENSPNEEFVSDVLVYACYKPLWRIACAERLRVWPPDAWPPAARETLRVSLHEPLHERGLVADMAGDATIRDAVSKAVQAQYEENPYPRWSAITRGATQNIEQWIRRWNPDYAAPAELRGPLRVLVAGCGSGMDAINTALHLHNARIDAIDLSRASLAYAMRKAREYGLENIRFRHQDILALGGDDASYDFINCTGVLHHMEDPAAGLQRLMAVLRPGGVIKLALYSALARAPLEKARELIRASGFGPRTGDIRKFRQQVFAEGAQGPHADLMGSTDFFSTSECRDLLFHVQETQLTLPGIRELLDTAKLEFLGFELGIAEVEQGFRREYPGAELTDLGAWNEYEQRHPHSFRAMYQFWCRRP